jgi:putative nucleotidyltransferase with HDIG domain
MAKDLTRIEYLNEKDIGDFALTDIYDINGKLLLGKGSKITQKVKEKLLQRGVVQEINLSTSHYDKQERACHSIIQTFGARKGICNLRIVDQANEILSSIVFESNSEPWQLHVHTMFSYLDWVYTHSIDVAMISLLIGIELGLDKKTQYNLGLGAFLHDIGKLMIPKAILQKPGPLTDMETKYMRQHCELGMNSLISFTLPSEILDIVIQHHEYLDGTGYPKGLMGETISRYAQIVMISDIFDGITSARPYKEALSIEEAIHILHDAKKYPQDLVHLLENVLEM